MNHTTNEITLASAPVEIETGHSWGRTDEDGYGICSRCGARENTYHSAKRCRGQSLYDEHDVSEKPVELEPVLALIETHTELGPQHWFEVVFHDGERWRSYEGSDTFSNGEIVTRWHYADGVFDRRHEA